MSESLKKYRAHFLKSGGQQKFLKEVRKRMHISDVAALCSCSERAVRDWQREKFHMNYVCMERLVKKLQLPAPLVEKVDEYEHVRRAGVLGGKAIVEKYGRVPVDEQYRKSQWKNWWSDVGSQQNQPILSPREILVPNKSEELAEFIGVMLGDGTIAPYHIAITLNSVCDAEYSLYIKKLILKLFGVEPKLYKRKDCQALNVVVARKMIVELMTEFGLPRGDKMRNGLSIPDWIQRNNSYALACVRGLMDTDGSVFTHRYLSKGREYKYKKWSFTSASLPLRKDVMRILSDNNINFSFHGTNIRIESIDSVQRYTNLVGTSNPKHLKRLTN